MLNTESYVELDGAHFFRLDKSYSDIKGGAIEMDFTIDSTVTSDTTMFLISSRTSSNVSDDRSFLINNGKFRNDIRGSRVLTTNTESIETGVRYRVYQIDNNCHVWDKASNEIIWGMRSTPSTNNNSYNTNPFLVGASYNSDSQIDTRRMIGKIYSLKLYKSGGELIRHYVPYAPDAMRDIVSGNIIYLQTSYTYQVKYNYVGGRVYANDELVGTITNVDTPITFEHSEPSVYVTCEGVPETKEEVLSTSTSTTVGDAVWWSGDIGFKQTNQIGGQYTTIFYYMFYSNYGSSTAMSIESMVYKTLDKRIRRTRYTVPYGEDITPNEVISFEYVEKSDIYIESTPQGSSTQITSGTDSTPVTISVDFYTTIYSTNGQTYSQTHHENISTTLGELTSGGYNGELRVTISTPAATGHTFRLQSGTATIYDYSKNIVK